MSDHPRTISPDADLKEAARLILEIKVGGLPVVRDGKLVGIITETDLINTMLEHLARRSMTRPRLALNGH